MMAWYSRERSSFKSSASRSRDTFRSSPFDLGLAISSLPVDSTIGLRRRNDNGDYSLGQTLRRRGGTLTWNLVHIFQLDGVVPRRAIMARQEKTLQDLFLDTLKDIYYAENKILKTLPKMAKTAQSKALRVRFSSTNGRPSVRSGGSTVCSS